MEATDSQRTSSKLQEIEKPIIERKNKILQ